MGIDVNKFSAAPSPSERVGERLLVYTHTITTRVAYAMELVFGTVLNSKYELTDNKKQFEDYTLPKIAYTTELTIEEIVIQSDKLLFETDIKSTLPLAEKNYEDFPKFFKSGSSDFLGYDIFAMVFYFATRYEEYVNVKTDAHQRFTAENSIAFEYNCLSTPFLNTAIDQFFVKLNQQFPSLVFKKRDFNFVSTIDIDNAFAYAHKGLNRNIGGFLKDVLTLHFTDTFSRIASNINEKKDPYNTFDLINKLSAETQTALQYFVLIGDYSTFDKNPNFKNPGFRKLLRSLSATHTLGLHPSYQSFSYPEKIEIEKKRLEDIIEKKVTSARCHFLRVKFPETYRHFLNTGITDDYTMIYASQSGFRTGLCMPYKWFDLEKNEQTNLTIHSSVIMEGALRDYNKYSPEKAIEIIEQLVKETKKQGGEFISIFHNDSFVTSQHEWINVYKKLLKESVK